MTLYLFGELVYNSEEFFDIEFIICELSVGTFSWMVSLCERMSFIRLGGQAGKEHMCVCVDRRAE